MRSQYGNAEFAVQGLPCESCTHGGGLDKDFLGGFGISHGEWGGNLARNPEFWDGPDM